LTRVSVASRPKNRSAGLGRYAYADALQFVGCVGQLRQRDLERREIGDSALDAARSRDSHQRAAIRWLRRGVK
jgi:hypothetical protein